MTSVQEKWAWCKKCENLWFSGDAGKYGTCAAGGGHVSEGSFNYKVHGSTGTVSCPSNYNAQNSWKWCRKCYCMTHASNQGRCPAGGAHDHSGSFDYGIAANVNVGGHQQGWSWCRKCSCMFFGPHKGSSNCAAGGQHDNTGSWQYSHLYDDSLRAQKEKEEREAKEREAKEREAAELRARIEREEREKAQRERWEHETRERVEREVRERVEREYQERTRREEEERKRRDEEDRKRREEEDRRRREAAELELKMNSVPYLRQLVEQLKIDLQNEKVARITAEVKLEKAGIKA